MILQMVEGDFSVYKVQELPAGLLQETYVFIGRTDTELSVISKTCTAPKEAFAVEHGWKCFRIAEDASFEKYGMIAFLSNIIAEEQTSTLVVGTFDTDYFFIKQEKIGQVKQALERRQCIFLEKDTEAEQDGFTKN